jgi:chloramphenicol O-acetyltransferase
MSVLFQLKIQKKKWVRHSHEDFLFTIMHVEPNLMKNARNIKITSYKNNENKKIQKEKEVNICMKKKQPITKKRDTRKTPGCRDRSRQVNKGYIGNAQHGRVKDHF